MNEYSCIMEEKPDMHYRAYVCIIISASFCLRSRDGEAGDTEAAALGLMTLFTCLLNYLRLLTSQRVVQYLN